MKHVVHPITLNDCRNVRIDINYVNSALSISGQSRNICGQMAEYLKTLPAEEYKLNPGWTSKMLDKLIAIWERWHLNDLQAGCAHQRKLGWNAKDHLNQPCPACGYRYGNAWLFEPVPDSVIEWLFALPEGLRQ